jgi:hypothetical protein
MDPALDPDFAAECASINTDRERMFDALSTARARGLTGADLDAIFKADDALIERAAWLKAAYYPRRAGRLSIALGSAVLVSPTGRTQTVWRAPRKTESEDCE